jgi:hypothetical protein
MRIARKIATREITRGATKADDDELFFPQHASTRKA